MSVIEDKQSHHLRLLLRLSVNDIYFVFSRFQVQKIASDIKSSLEVEDNVEINQNTSTPVRGGRPNQDKAVGVWTSVFCELSRHD